MGVRVNAERDLDIWSERKEHGTTLKAIGQKHGISGPRVREIVAREDRRLAWRVRHEEILRQKEQVMEVKKITRDTLISDLEISVRLQHSLINDWRRPQNPKRPATVGDFIDVPIHELLRIPNLGRKALVEWRNIVWALENPDSPVIEEQMAEYKALKDIRATINQIAATHRKLATHYNNLADIITPMI